MRKNKIKNKKSKMIPINIKKISFSLFLFMIGRGLGGDTFFSVYVKRILGASIGVTLIGTLLAIVKLVVVVPVGVMNNQGNTGYLLLLGKAIYAISGYLYFLAGTKHSLTRLIFAVITNGVASSMMFASYRSLYGKKGQKKNRTKVFGIYFSSINMAYVIGALISAIFVHYIDLPYMYLFIVIFSMLSLTQDAKTQDIIKKHTTKSWKKLDKKTIDEYEIDEDLHNMKKFMGKKGVLHEFIKEIFSARPRKSMFIALKSYGWPMYIALASIALTSFMNYVGFLFIPIVAIENNLTLPQIAILFAVMRIPYIINIFIGNIGDKYSKKILITILILICATIYVLLGFFNGFLEIVLLSFGNSLLIAILFPVTTALVSGYTRKKDNGIMSGVQEFVSRIGEIIGSLGFGGLATCIGMNNAFIILGISLITLSGYLLTKKIINRSTKDNEILKEKLAQTPIGSN